MQEIGDYSSQPLEKAIVSALNNKFEGVRGKHLSFQINTASGWYAISCQKFDGVNGIAQRWDSSNDTYAFYVPHGGADAVLKKLGSGGNIVSWKSSYIAGNNNNPLSSCSEIIFDVSNCNVVKWKNTNTANINMAYLTLVLLKDSNEIFNVTGNAWDNGVSNAKINAELNKGLTGYDVSNCSTFGIRRICRWNNNLDFTDIKFE